MLQYKPLAGVEEQHSKIITLYYIRQQARYWAPTIEEYKHLHEQYADKIAGHLEFTTNKENSERKLLKDKKEIIP